MPGPTDHIQTFLLHRARGQELESQRVVVEGAEVRITTRSSRPDHKTGQPRPEDSKAQTYPTPAEAQAAAQQQVARAYEEGFTDAPDPSTSPTSTGIGIGTGPLAHLPRLLEPYRAAIAATLRPRLRLERAGRSQSVLQSKLGGVPYRVRGQAWPADDSGKPLTFLAQLNFADLPALPGYPARGILQFFIGKDDLFGCDFGGLDGVAPGSFQTRWISDPLDDLQHLETVSGDSAADDHDGPFSHVQPADWTLSGVADLQALPPADRLFDTVLAPLFDGPAAPPPRLRHRDQLDYLRDLYGDFVGRGGHQVGGYPYFTQQDPRPDTDPRVLLLQLDSDEGLRWGDNGVANFFIDPDDLARRDFSRVLYNWDCY